MLRSGVSDRRRPAAAASRGRLGLTLAAALTAAALAPAAGLADKWLVYLGGGLEPIEDGWSERRGRIVFTRLGGTLVSIPFDDVDLAASAFVTWQLGGRDEAPPRAPLPPADAPPGGHDGLPCRPARVLALLGSETLEVTAAGGTEIVHVACLDAPEAQHRFAELGWFGRAAQGMAEAALPAGAEVCLAEARAPLRDGRGHRIVRVGLADGRDYAAEVIGAGFGLLAPGPCGQAARYRALENAAIAGERGLWGPPAAEAAFAAVRHTGAVAAGPPPPRPRASGGG